MFEIFPFTYILLSVCLYGLLNSNVSLIYLGCKEGPGSPELLGGPKLEGYMEGPQIMIMILYKYAKSSKTFSFKEPAQMDFVSETLKSILWPLS